MSAPSKHGGPAFPVAFRMNYKQVILEDGISVRDYFAAQALAGLLSSGIKSQGWEETIAFDSYKIADAMLVRREVNP
jgi:hypothetical protein